jgi:hypothetical protein
MSDIQDPTRPEDDRPQDAKPKKPPRPMWQTLLYNAMPLVFLAVVGAIGLPILQDMMAPPRRNLYVERPAATSAPTAAPITAPAAAPTPAQAPAPAAPRPAMPTAGTDLVRAFGAPVLAEAGRDATRLAQIGQDALRCGMRDTTWFATLQEAAGADVASRYNSFDGKPEDNAALARYAAQNFAAASASTNSARDCADIPSLPDFRAADTLVRTRRSAAAPRR